VVTGVWGVSGLFSKTFLKCHSFTGYRGEGVGRELRGRAWALGEVVGVLFMFLLCADGGLFSAKGDPRDGAVERCRIPPFPQKKAERMGHPAYYPRCPEARHLGHPAAAG
jgi:hypothetical protein